MSTEDDIEDSAAPLIEHLTELRTRLIHSVVAFIVGMIICFTVWNPIFDFLTHPLCGALAERGQSDCGLILIKLQEGFFVAISISLIYPSLTSAFRCGAFWRPDFTDRKKVRFCRLCWLRRLCFFWVRALRFML